MQTIRQLKQAYSSKSVFLKAGFLSLLVFISFRPVIAQTAKPCPFEETDDKALAKCLLRFVKPKAELGATLATLPEPLEALLGQPGVAISLAQVKSYLAKQGINASLVGGELTAISDVRFFVNAPSSGVA